MRRNGRAADKSCSVLVVKVASRCNLNCSYCYVYNAGDETFRTQPARMAREVSRAMFARVNEHCAEHRLTNFTFVIHGGEPLLAGKEFFRRFAADARASIADAVALDIAVQTNGTLIDTDWCTLFNELGISVGISIDGPRDLHDRYRVDHAGHGSYRRVRAGIQCAVEHLISPPGLLSVIDPSADPGEVWRHATGLGVSSVNFLFPDATHDTPPPQRDLGNPTIYGDWLVRVFDLWYDSGGAVRVPLFEQIMGAILGYPTTQHGVGKSQTGVLVVETNGDLEPVDYMKVCQPGMTKIGANVRTQTLTEMLDHPLIAAYYDAAGNACDTCESCAIFGVCGGGMLVHRWSTASGFDNPTVYCADRMKLIVYIQNRILEDLPARAIQRAGVRPFSIKEVRASIDTAVEEPRLIETSS